MDFIEEITSASTKFRNKFSDIVNVGIDIDNAFVSFHEINSFSLQYSGLLNTVRRNHLLSNFLFESGQSNAGIQASRTMIESAEIVCAYIIDGKKSHEFVLTSLKNPPGDKILDKLRNSVILPYLQEHDELMELSISVKSIKDQMNSMMTHANPAYNFLFASGINESGIQEWLLNTDSGDGKIQRESYIFSLICFYYLFQLIETMACNFGMNKFSTEKSNQLLSDKLNTLQKKYTDWPTGE